MNLRGLKRNKTKRERRSYRVNKKNRHTKKESLFLRTLILSRVAMKTSMISDLSSAMLRRTSRGMRVRILPLTTTLA